MSAADLPSSKTQCICPEASIGFDLHCRSCHPDEQPSSNTGFVCPDCRNTFLQEPRCTTCGAEKLYDATVRGQAATIERLSQDVARYESGRVVLTLEIETLRQQNANQRELIERREKQLSERLQNLEELKQKLTAAEQLAVRQAHTIRQLFEEQRP